MKKILLVDDSTTILLSMSAILTKAGYEASTAANADEGLSKLKGGLKPDLLITDLNMPGMNGIDFIKDDELMGNPPHSPLADRVAAYRAGYLPEERGLFEDQKVIDTLVYLERETNVWFEITNLLIPGLNDSAEEVHAMTTWVIEHLGDDVPMHFTAFHPDWKMLDKPRTPAATLTRARRIALANGLRYVYTGNVHDTDGGSTYCPRCGMRVIERDWYELGAWRLTETGGCTNCGTQIPGVFAGRPGAWGARRVGVRLAAS